MKKITKFVLVLAIGAALYSCEDSYKIVQGGELNEATTFLTVDDMQLFLNGVYDQATIRPEIGFTSIFTDETGIGSQSGGQDIDLYKYTLNSNDGFADQIWLNQYTLINYANRLLRGASRITPTADNLAQYNSIIAEAKVLRAFGHLQLLTYYSTDLKNDNAPGVIALDRVPDLAEQLPRNTNGEVFTLIESDLAYADANLVDHTGASAYKYATHNLVNAMRARMYAYRGKYTQAETYADQVIAASTGLLPGGTVAGNYNQFTNTGAAPGIPKDTNPFYSLTTAPANDNAKMWGDWTQGEVIFALSRPATANQEQIASLFYFNYTRLNGGPYHDMDYNLYTLLQDPNGDGNSNDDFDIRRIAFVDYTSVIPVNPEATTGDFRNLSVPCIDKYRGKSGPSGSDLVNDLKPYRVSEMFLIKAEARVAAGDLGGAATIIKQIRDARIYTETVHNNTSSPVTFLGVVIPAGADQSYTSPPRTLPVYTDATAAWADILKERRVELCFEGHRYIDLKRLGGLAGVTVDRFHRECETNNVPVCIIPVTDHRFTMPIPLGELLGNHNIQQNPEY